MDSDAKLRPLFLGKILFELTDEEHFLTTAQLMQILEKIRNQVTPADKSKAILNFCDDLVWIFKKPSLHKIDTVW